ncbi:nuclear transport factor 2 family protein [Isoptericola sp. BMS4]|uniref:nuclear transport factor 2 family protein n=1 Tax=Isoptericola sp. BMS4 TaxID=2527875 RepID=UPI00141DB4DD|nr:nuclear transport factor 2 family protein [Isoptericola sp. BMS4]
MPTATAVVAEQVDAFNARDLDRFVATYAPDAVVTGVTPDPIVGRDALRAFYGGRFDDAALHCEITTSVAFGERWVVARELVTTANGTGETVATFDVADGVIARASMLKA